MLGQEADLNKSKATIITEYHKYVETLPATRLRDHVINNPHEFAIDKKKALYTSKWLKGE